MLTRWKGRTSWFPFLGVIGTVLLFPMSALGVNTGFQFDPAGLDFSYVPTPGPQEVGTVTIREGACPTLVLQHLDLGADGIYGGAYEDIPIDLAHIYDAASCDVEFDGVVKGGSGNYWIEGTLRIVDTTAITMPIAKVEADFVSNAVELKPATPGYYYFFFEGDLSVSAGNDALLVPGPGASWEYCGDPAFTPSDPNEDNVVGRVGLDDGRTDFTFGSFSSTTFNGCVADLDTFFASNQSSVVSTGQVVVLPEPTTAVLGLMCLGLVGRNKR